MFFFSIKISIFLFTLYQNLDLCFDLPVNLTAFFSIKISILLFNLYQNLDFFDLPINLNAFLLYFLSKYEIVYQHLACCFFRSKHQCFYLLSIKISTIFWFAYQPKAFFFYQNIHFFTLYHNFDFFFDLPFNLTAFLFFSIKIFIFLRTRYQNINFISFCIRI